MPKILFVDDDDYLRTMYAEVLTKSGFMVREAKDGAEGLEYVRQYKPDLIFTGIEMPNLTGFELMQELQEEPGTRKIPVVIFSHKGRERDRQEAKKLGAKAFLVRHFTPPRKAVEKIREILDTAVPQKILRVKTIPEGIIMELTPIPGKPDEFRAKVIAEEETRPKADDNFSQILSDVEKKLK